MVKKFFISLVFGCTLFATSTRCSGSQAALVLGVGATSIALITLSVRSKLGIIEESALVGLIVSAFFIFSGEV